MKADPNPPTSVANATDGRGAVIARESGATAPRAEAPVASTPEAAVLTRGDDDELNDPIKLAQRMSEFLSRRY